MTVDDALVVADIQVQPRNPLGAQRVYALVVLGAEVRRLRQCLHSIVECGVYCADCGSYCTARDEATFTGDAERAEWTCTECLRDQEVAS
jgi:hypothetical protein